MEMYFGQMAHRHVENWHMDIEKGHQSDSAGLVQGEMPDGTEVAVRRLSLNSRQGKREFVKGVKSIMDLNHRNVVRLVGCCYTNTRLLAYEFVENGTLAQSLFGNILLNSTSTLISH